MHLNDFYECWYFDASSSSVRSNEILKKFDSLRSNQFDWIRFGSVWFHSVRYSRKVLKFNCTLNEKFRIFAFLRFDRSELCICGTLHLKVFYKFGSIEPNSEKKKFSYGIFWYLIRFDTILYVLGENLEILLTVVKVKNIKIRDTFCEL